MQRFMKSNGILILLLTFGIWSESPTASADEPSWAPQVIARGEFRQQIEATPIEQRPYRPFHFYGNTVRRQHYRGNPIPRPTDIGRTMIFAVRVR